MILPHIDLNVGGATYAHGYQEILKNSQADLFVILGVQITTNGSTQFEGVGGVAQLVVGDLVRVGGQKLGDRALRADEVEVDD